MVGAQSWTGELCREQGAQLGGVSRRPGRPRRRQVRIRSARGTFVQLGRLPPAPGLPGARRLQGARLVRTSRRPGARTPARDTERQRGPGGRLAPNGSPRSLSARTPSVDTAWRAFPIPSWPWAGSTSHHLAKSLQSCPILCNPIDGSPPGSPVPGILQARTLEWVAISFCRVSSQPRN